MLSARPSPLWACFPTWNWFRCPLRPVRLCHTVPHKFHGVSLPPCDHTQRTQSSSPGSVASPVTSPGVGATSVPSCTSATGGMAENPLAERQVRQDVLILGNSQPSSAISGPWRFLSGSGWRSKRVGGASPTLHVLWKFLHCQTHVLEPTQVK